MFGLGFSCVNTCTRGIQGRDAMDTSFDHRRFSAMRARFEARARTASQSRDMSRLRDENERLRDENERLRRRCGDLTSSAELWIRLYEAALERVVQHSGAAGRLGPGSD